MTPSDRLLARLRLEFPHLPIDATARIVRTRAGHWQLDAGAWRWEIHKKELYPQIGSQYRVSDCLKAEKLEATSGNLWNESDIYIDPVAAHPGGGRW